MTKSMTRFASAIVAVAALIAAPADAAVVGQVHAAVAAKPSPMSRHRVEQVQAALANSGETLPIDGIWGKQTRSALRDYQKQHGLRASGQLNRATLRKLNPPTWKG
ncbi:MAG TPA: peptidoglycan-binding domain-containing protein [Candidatus Cybelea sp.]|nr:peptidoglycan-binding domain-containing protein [Candidatus Cybelea sp.]